MFLSKICASTFIIPSRKRKEGYCKCKEQAKDMHNSGADRIKTPTGSPAASPANAAVFINPLYCRGLE
ncbi:hypothetical protein XENORESO_020021 [Xenotaenia resolanae]|uniref:Uncharacterized protein n=1 Tax=Xenotaenia resolanae TaxID=208358 RepID=A0ABV0X0G4_9TELE